MSNVNSQKKKKNSNRIAISTSLRIKPTPSNHNEHKLSIDDDENNNTLLSSFTHILNSKQTQLQCYNQTCSQSIHEFLNYGCNCTFFVYGQTGSGKTHTLFGPPNSFHSESLASTNVDEVFHNVKIPTSWGIFPRVVLHLLSNQQQQQQNNKQQQQSQTNNIGITATAVEIYMDNCYDLIQDKQKISIEGYGKSNKVSGRGSFLETTQVKRDGSGKWIPPRTLVDKQQSLNNNEGYGMSGAKSTILSNVNELLDFMRIVEATRTSKSHKLNERSSRSHCVITLSIPSISNAKYMLVDLAGSERIMKSGTIQCELKAAEAKNINTSLTSLGRCITALSKGDVFVPYRDSVLTMLLKQSLGGRCYTSVIITGTEDSEMHQETISSIKFGKRCSKVVNRQAKERGSSTTNNDERKKTLLAELQLIDIELSNMAKTGKAGGLNTTDFPKSLQTSFLSNMTKYKQHKKAYESLQQQIKAGKTTSSILKAKQYEHSQVKNLQGILLRSMTTGIWTDPSPAYMKYVQRRIDIVSTLRGMNVNGSVLEEKKIVDIDIPMTFEHLLLGFEG